MTHIKPRGALKQCIGKRSLQRDDLAPRGRKKKLSLSSHKYSASESSAPNARNGGFYLISYIIIVQFIVYLRLFVFLILVSCIVVLSADFCRTDEVLRLLLSEVLLKTLDPPLIVLTEGPTRRREKREKGEPFSSARRLTRFFAAYVGKKDSITS